MSVKKITELGCSLQCFSIITFILNFLFLVGPCIGNECPEGYECHQDSCVEPPSKQSFNCFCLFYPKKLNEERQNTSYVAESNK